MKKLIKQASSRLKAFICKAETDSQTQRTGLPRRRWGGRVLDWELGTSQYKLLYIEWINKILLYSTCTCAKLLQSCPALCEAMDHSPPGSFVHGISQARILEWIAMPSSRGSSQLRDQTRVSNISCIGRQVLYHQRHLKSLQHRVLY